MSNATEPEGFRRLRHDLRTPLTVVSGFAELMCAERPLTDDDRRDFAQRILAAAHEIRELLDGVQV